MINKFFKKALEFEESISRELKYGSTGDLSRSSAPSSSSLNASVDKRHSTEAPVMPPRPNSASGSFPSLINVDAARANTPPPSQLQSEAFRPASVIPLQMAPAQEQDVPRAPLPKVESMRHASEELSSGTESRNRSSASLSQTQTTEALQLRIGILENTLKTLREKASKRITSLQAQLEEAQQVQIDRVEFEELKAKLTQTELDRLQLLEKLSEAQAARGTVAGESLELPSQSQTQQHPLEEGERTELLANLAALELKYSDLEKSQQALVKDHVEKDALIADLQRQKEDAVSWKNTHAAELETLKVHHAKEVETLKESLKDVEVRLQSLSATQNKVDAPSEAEGRVFSLEEQIKELKLHNTSTQVELVKVQEALNKQRAENERLNVHYEDKIKKIKGLFAIANKNINEQKQTITTHENKCKELEAELEQEKELLKQSQATIEEQKAAIQKLALMEDERSAVREVADKEKEMTQDRLEKELALLKQEYANYKLRAHTALSKRSDSSNEKQLNELSSGIQMLEREKSELIKSTQVLKNQNETLGQQLRAAQDINEDLLQRIEDLESSLEKNASFEKELFDLRVQAQDLQKLREQDLQNQQHMFDSHLKKTLAASKSDIDDLMNKLTEKESEVVALKQLNQQLSDQLASVKKEFDTFRDEMEQSRHQEGSHSTITSNIALRDFKKSSSGSSSKLTSPTAMLSLEDLIQHTEDDMVTSGKLVELEQCRERLRDMSRMIVDNEATIEELKKDVTILKEELMKEKRMDRLERLNIPYLKNVILKFVESTDKQPLIPVIAQLLELDKDELKILQSKVGTTGPISIITNALW